MAEFLRQQAAAGEIGTALGEAARCELTELVQELLANGADPNSRDGAGYTPLMLAGSVANVRAMQLLIEAGADVNARGNRDGETALMSLLMTLPMQPLRACLSACKMLLDAGADPNIRTKTGATALDFAMEGRPQNVVDFLLQAKAVAGEPGAIQKSRGPVVDLDAFALNIRRKKADYVASNVFAEIPLPAPEQLKQDAIDSLDEDAASILRDCDLSYDLTKGKDITEPLIEVVIAAPAQAYKVLRDHHSHITQAIMAALMEICPDLGSDRLVRKEDPTDNVKS